MQELVDCVAHLSLFHDVLGRSGSSASNTEVSQGSIVEGDRLHVLRRGRQPDALSRGHDYTSTNGRNR